jgi:hypothetical protein
MTGYSDDEAYEMAERGINVIVECETCGDRLWSLSGTYTVQDGNWYCDGCYTEPERQTMDTSELEG